MNMQCPVLVDKGARRCEGELEIEFERVDSGDGVYSESGWAAILPCDDDGHETCSEGCKLTPEQVRRIEEDAVEGMYNDGY